MTSDESPSIRHMIDQLCDRFEQALKAGQSPSVNEFLADVPEAHCDELRSELAGLQQDYDDNRRGYEATIAPTDSSNTMPEFDATIDSKYSPANSRLAAGEQLKYFGNYEIISEIARGGMGVVYRARQTTLGRTVALKMILSGQLAGEREIARFQSEAEAAANLDHPGIVPIYEVGRHDDHHYFSMGLVEGQSLADVIRDGPMEPRKAAECLAKIADAIRYANDKGVIHRDLKPGNILLDTDGDPHVTDFGLAKRLEAEQELTTSGEVLGTPAYMPPEQARGDLEAIGPASDVYALGAIFYAMLSGRPPHSAPSIMETLRQVIEVDAVSVRSLSPGTPKDLETICAKCLSKEPAKRYAGGGELRDELERFLRGEPILARPVSRIERGWRWAKRRPGLAGLSAALMLLIAGLAVGGPVVAVNQARLKQTAEDNEARATLLATSERKAKELAQDSQAALALAKDRSDRSLYARTVSLAHQEWQSGNLTGAEDLLASLPTENRGFEWDYVDSLCHQQLHTFLDMSGVPYFVEMTADGMHVVASGHDPRSNSHKTYLWQIGQTQPIAIRDGRAMAASVDGNLIALVPPGEDATFQVVDTITGEVRQTFAGHEGGTHRAAFSGPDNQRIATTGRDKVYRVWDITSGKELVKIENPHRQRLHPIALSPNGQTIAWRRADDGAIEIRETSRGNILFEGAAEKSLATKDSPIAFSPDGKLLAFGGFGEVALIDVNSGTSAGSFQGIRAHALSLDFSPDGHRLVVSSQDGTIRVYDVDGRKLLTTMTGHKVGQSYGVNAVAFDGSGDHIVSGGFDAVIKVWDSWNGDRTSIADSTRPQSELPSPSQSADFVTTLFGGVEQLRFSSDGKLLLATGRNRTAQVIDPQTGETIRHWTELDGNQGAIDFDPASGLVVVGGGSIEDRQPGIVTALDFQTGEKVWKFTDSRGPVSSIRFFDSGKRIAIGVGSQNATIGVVMVIDAVDGKLVWRNEKSILPVRSLAVSPDGKTLASVGVDEGITFWDSATGKPRDRLGDRIFFAVEFSDDGSKICVGGIDWSVRMFDVQDKELVWSQVRHSGAVTGLAFTSNDTRLVSTSLDGHTHIWDTRHGDSILQLRDSDQENLAMAVAPDASIIAVAGINPTIVLRRTASSGASVRIGPDGKLIDADQWLTVIEDNFDRDKIGDAWTPAGMWSIEDGAAVGVLYPTPYAPGLNAANLASDTMLSSDFEVSFDAWVDSPMCVEAKVSDLKAANAISTLYIGMTASPFNRGEKGVAVIQAFRGNYRDMGSRRDGPFTFDLERKYRFSTRRVGRRVDMFIEDELYRTVELAIETPMPMMSLQGIFGKVGGKVFVDNVVVKVPPEGRAEMDAAQIVADLFGGDEIKPLVIAKLKSMESSEFGEQPVETRRAAINMAQRWFQEEKTIIDKIESLATDGAADMVTYQALFDWIDQTIRVKSQRVYRVAAMCAFRMKNNAACWEAIKQSDQQFRKDHGSRHPIDVSMPAMMMWNSGNKKAGTDRVREINQLMLADHWKRDEQAVAWTELANQTIEADPPDPVFDALAGITWNQQHSLLIKGDAGPLADSLAPEAVRIVRRNAGDDQYAWTTGREDWVTSEKIWAMGGPSSLKKLVRTACAVDSKSETPTVTSHFTIEGPGSNFGWVQNDVFKELPGVAPEQWKIVKQDWRVTRIKLDGDWTNVDVDYWKQADKEVEQAAKSDNLIEQLFALMKASRLEEALAVAKRHAANSGDALAQTHLAEIAQWCGDTKTLVAAAKKAVELDPMVRAPAAIRAIAAKTLAAKTAFSFAENATVRPPSFYRRSSKELLAAGENGLVCWQPTEDSLVGIIKLPPAPGTTPSQYVDAIIDSRIVGYQVELNRRDSRTIDGYPAIEYTQSGLGIGRAIAGSGRPTFQRFVLIDRDGDLFLALVTAYGDDFDVRDAEFEQFLLSMKLRPSTESDSQ